MWKYCIEYHIKYVLTGYRDEESDVEAQCRLWCLTVQGICDFATTPENLPDTLTDKLSVSLTGKLSHIVTIPHGQGSELEARCRLRCLMDSQQCLTVCLTN